MGDSPTSQQLSQADNRWRLLCSNLLWMVGEDGHFVGCSVLVFGKLLDLMVLSPRPSQDSVVRHRPLTACSLVVQSLSFSSQTMSPELKAALSILSSALQSVLQPSVLSTCCDVDNLGIVVIDHVVVDILLLLLLISRLLFHLTWFVTVHSCLHAPSGVSYRQQSSTDFHGDRS